MYNSPLRSGCVDGLISSNTIFNNTETFKSPHTTYTHIYYHILIDTYTSTYALIDVNINEYIHICTNMTSNMIFVIEKMPSIIVYMTWVLHVIQADTCPYRWIYTHTYRYRYIQANT